MYAFTNQRTVISSINGLKLTYHKAPPLICYFHLSQLICALNQGFTLPFSLSRACFPFSKKSNLGLARLDFDVINSYTQKNWAGIIIHVNNEPTQFFFFFSYSLCFFQFSSLNFFSQFNLYFFNLIILLSNSMRLSFKL